MRHSCQLGTRKGHSTRLCAQERRPAMKISRFRLITFLALSRLMPVAVVVFGSWYAPAFGGVGLRLQNYLSEPPFRMGGLPITFFFHLKAAIFFVALILVSHFTMLLLQKPFFHFASSGYLSAVSQGGINIRSILRKYSRSSEMPTGA